jgi:hypothetical protein
LSAPFGVGQSLKGKTIMAKTTKTTKTTQQAASTAPAATPDINALVAAAVAAALAGQAPAKGTKTPKTAAAVIAAPQAPKTRREAFEQYLSKDQARELDGSFAIVSEHSAQQRKAAEEHDARAESLKARMRGLVAKVWPKACDFDTYNNVRSVAYQYDVAGALIAAPKEGEKRAPNVGAMYWGKCLAEAYKTAHGALPTKGTGTGEGTKGMSPKRAARGFASKVADVLEYVATLKKQDINASVLGRVEKAVAELIAATEAMAKAVNE